MKPPTKMSRIMENNEPTTDQIEAKLKKFKVVQWTTMMIFAVIILIWIFLGYWRSNLPVFISTVAMAIAISASLYASQSGLKLALQCLQNRN